MIHCPRPARPPWPRCSRGVSHLLRTRRFSPSRSSTSRRRSIRSTRSIEKWSRLRHFEQLNRAETAEVLGITEEAGAKRYIRALKKLKSILAAMPGGLEGF